MSTSDLPREATDLIPTEDSLRAPSESGLPEAAAIEKLANEFFRAVSVQDVTLAPVSAEIQNVRIPTEDQLRALPATLTAAAAPAQAAAESSASWPEIPGSAAAGDFSRIPSFSFLQEARSLFANPLPSSFPIPPAATTLKIPYETELRDLPASLSVAKMPHIPASAAELASPQIPGASFRDLDMSRLGSFNFLEEAKPLERVSPQTNFSPISSNLAPAAFSDLSSVPFDVGAVRRDFPILQEKINGRQLVWLDNAATTQKPQSVIDRLSYFYTHENSNIHRAAHTLAARATDAYEAAREKVRRFLNASSSGEIIFVRGATEAINLVAQSWGRRNIQKDDEIVITWLEHHANIVPWQMLCAEKGAKLRVAPVDNSGQVLLDEYEKLLNSRTRLVAFAHVSNALGTVTPAEEMIDAAHRHGAKVLVDGAQAVSHLPRRCPGSRLRFLRLLRPQNLRPHRHRRRLRQSAMSSNPRHPGRGAAT